MEFIDSHTHLFLEDFDSDRTSVIENAIANGIIKMILPNIDQTTVERLQTTCDHFPKHCFAALGLHPTSVKQDYKDQIEQIFKFSNAITCIALGEIGIDLYWDKTYIELQRDAFRYQVNLAKELNLPVIIHCRDAFDEIIAVLRSIPGNLPSGVFHSFTGTREQAHLITDLGFKIGINGVVTYKNAKMGDMIANIPLESMLLETDSPYLTPVPFRGKRNESSYLIYIAQKIADIKNIPVDLVASATTINAKMLFNI
jgi:TatD DNase family protein